MFNLVEHGDREERAASIRFAGNEFPQYEAFWRVFVVALTGRVNNVNVIEFRPQVELDAEGRPEWHVEVAQLHYTTLLHLIRVYELRQRRIRDRDSFLEAIVRLDAAGDTAGELLGRCLVDCGFKPAWNERRGRDIRENWYERDGQPLKRLRDYRNALLHGRIRPEHELTIENGAWKTRVPFYPTFDAVSKPSTLDWRTADFNDAAPADQLVDEGWELVLTYFRSRWDGQLLPWANQNIVVPDPPQIDSPQLHAPLPPATGSSATMPALSASGGSAVFPVSDTRATDDE